MKHPNTPDPGPTHIQQYDILDCIGRGGMGLVYLAHDTRLERRVAIKYLRTELFEPHYRERFKREALLLAKLNHPNIVQIYDFIESPEQLALVMEYVDGKNLQQHLREHVVPLSLRISWLTQIAQGLAVAHDAGIIHRDLKFENILITQRNEAKITDLGIAKSQDFNSTLTDHVTGSYCAMSPEQARGDNIDFKSDLFSFGILAYQLLCGAHPFGDTSNKLQLMQRIILQPPTPPTAHNPNLPAEAVNLLGQLLSKNPNDRPENTHWVAEQCKNISQYLVDTPLDSDNTMVLTPTHHSQAGIRNTNHRTQDHPTFDTRFETKPFSITQKIHRYIKYHTTAFVSIVLTAIILLSASIWYFMPKPARYIAVLPPQLTSDVMPESQQALVKDAVYDAIQQSVLQLDGYYLIPRDEIADINASNNKEGLEVVRRATAADELITTNIQCKIESCNIVLSRLTPDGKKQESRLRVQDTKTVDVLTDNYLSVATIVQNNIGVLYSKNINNSFERIDDKDYARFLEINNLYREKGASKKLLLKVEELQTKTKQFDAVQTLYTDIGLDLHSITKDSIFLEKIERILELNPSKDKKITYLNNLFYLRVANNHINEATKTLEEIKKINPSNSSINELYGYKMMETNDYKSAVNFYKKAIESKKSANNYFLLAKAYWYSGDTPAAQKYIAMSLSLSPNYYKANDLLGLSYLVNGEVQKASDIFEKNIQQKPDDTQEISNLGLCYLLLGKYDRASELFDHAYQLAPQFNTLLLNKADAENLAGHQAQAKLIYQKIIQSIETDNISKENLRNLSQAYAQLGLFQDALKNLQQLEQADAQNIETTYTAALVHTLASNNASAILYTETTLKNGMNKIWFSFPWFDALCKDEKFNIILKNYGEPNRCAPRKI